MPSDAMSMAESCTHPEIGELGQCIGIVCWAKWVEMESQGILERTV